MVCKTNIAKSTGLRNFFLRIQLKMLESKRLNEITEYIARCPSPAAKSDNIELKINTKTLRDTELKIKYIKRLLDQADEN